MTTKKVWVLVETVSSFRHRYMVEAPEGFPEFALDDVAMETAKEFSQKHIGELITSYREIPEQEALALCDEDNDYFKHNTTETKIRVFFTKEGETRDV